MQRQCSVVLQLRKLPCGMPRFPACTFPTKHEWCMQDVNTTHPAAAAVPRDEGRVPPRFSRHPPSPFLIVACDERTMQHQHQHRKGTERKRKIKSLCVSERENAHRVGARAPPQATDLGSVDRQGVGRGRREPLERRSVRGLLRLLHPLPNHPGLPASAQVENPRTLNL